MRRRPDEDDQEQQQGMRIQAVGERGPAQDRRRGTGGSADDDVLRRGTLEVHGVDHGVANQREEGEYRRQRVDEYHQYQHGQRAKRSGKQQRIALAELAFRQRTIDGARHPGILARIEHVVDGRRCGSGHADTEVAEQQHIPGHHARRRGREEHTHHGGEHDQRHDFQLAQAQVVLDNLHVPAAPSRSWNISAACRGP